MSKSMYDNGDLEALRNIIQEWPILLTTDTTFSTCDLPGSWERGKAPLEKLKMHGAIQNVGIKYIERGRTRNRWQWDEDVREELRKYYEKMNKLPCGHRGHIKHKKDGGFGCKYCPEDEQPNYDKETVRRAME